ncbi:hypothetical protein VTG60DRAFT_217 [Thermothelomyces hinnuleus]
MLIKDDEGRPRHDARASHGKGHSVCFRNIAPSSAFTGLYLAIEVAIIITSASTFCPSVGALQLFADLFSFAIIVDFPLSKLGRSKPLHLIQVALVTSHTVCSAAWACFQLFCAAGSGLMITILLPALQPPLDEA